MMKEKLDLKERSRLESWFFSYRLRSGRAAPATTPEQQHFLNSIWPMAEKYHSPIPSTFLLQHIRLSSLNESPLWLIRDGLVPLLWFFRTHPSPGRIKTRLLVHADFAWAVPSAWRARAGTYQIVSLPTQSIERARNKRFILADPLGETVCGIEALNGSLATLRKRFGPKMLKNIDVVAFLPARLTSLRTNATDTYHALCLKAIFNIFGTSAHIRFVGWNRLRFMEDFVGEFVEFNDRHLWADNFLLHHALSAGCRIAGAAEISPSREAGKMFELSPYHGFLVNFNLPRIRGLLRSRHEAKRTALMSAANRCYPWQTWMIGAKERV